MALRGVWVAMDRTPHSPDSVVSILRYVQIHVDTYGDVQLVGLLVGWSGLSLVMHPWMLDDLATRTQVLSLVPIANEEDLQRMLSGDFFILFTH